MTGPKRPVTKAGKNGDDLRWLERTATRVTIGVYVALLVLGILSLLLRSG